ncbi:MAG: HipA domain-containing protein [Pseudoflavonifractor sp.]|nr:HipA domain-containing protein [Pseudoflavonifractor sp.]
MTDEGEQGTYILKPRLDDFYYREYSPANENLTMQIADQVYNIATAPNAMVFFKTGEAAYVTRRYDIGADGTKIQQEDFASLGGLNDTTAGPNYKYDALSYEGIAALIRRYIPAWRVEMSRFFELMLFNFLFSNGDAHLKNFSVLKTPDGDYRLSPAYDLINTHIHIPTDRIFALERGLFSDSSDRGIPVTGTLFHSFGTQIGLPTKTVNRIIDKYRSNYDLIDTLISNSFLSDELKRMYKQMYHTRLVSYLRT